MTNLIVSSGVSVMLLSARIIFTENISYIFLLWNLFLAWIPLLISMNINGNKSKQKIFLMLCTWLLFFPNSPYIITDLFHFRPRGIPLWFDLVLIVSFAWNGMMLGFISLFQVQKYFDEKFGKIKSWMMVLSVFVLCGFGIYLGRYGRFNSWDVLVNPFELMSEIIQTIIHPLRSKETYSVTMLFSTFLFCCYSTIFALVKSHKHEND